MEPFFPELHPNPGWSNSCQSHDTEIIHTNSSEKYYCSQTFVLWLTGDDKCTNLRGEMINYQNKVINLFFVYDDILKRNILSNYILPGDGSLKLKN